MLMKKLKHLKKLIELIDEYSKESKSEIEKIKKEHQKLILLSNYNLISEISKGENLDEGMLVEKYMKKLKKSSCIKESNSELKEDIKEELLLNFMNYEGVDYYYEDKPNGNVYDNQSKKVGLFKFGNIKLDS